MPLDAEGHWNREKVVTGAELRKVLAEAIGPLSPVMLPDSSQPSADYQFADGKFSRQNPA